MAERPEIDRWILSVLNTLIKEVDRCYNEYEPTKAGRLISDFVNDNLSNWYVRLNRKRFWGGEFTQDKLSAYQTLYTCLETVAKLMAPVSPFYADRLYTDLITATGRDNVVSVHLAEFPKYQEEMIDKELEARMQMAQDVTSMVLALRRKVNIKVRQPLQCIMIPVVDEEQKAHIEAVKALIMNEVNVKDIKFVDGDAGVLVKKVKCDFKKLGPKFGKQMKAVAAAVAEMSQEAIAELEKNGKEDRKQLIIYENQPGDFWGLKNRIEHMDVQQNSRASAPVSGKHSIMQLPFVTGLIALANILVYIILSFGGATEDAFYMASRGAMYPEFLTINHQWWRLLTAIFLHFGVAHLMNNMVIFCCVGSRLEKYIGHWKMAVVYFAAGIGGGLLSYIMMLLSGNYAVSGGASGAVFGVIGGLLWVVIYHRGKLEGMTTKGILIMIVLSLYFGFTSIGVDNWCHVGGMLCGFLATLILYHGKRQKY